MTALFDQRRPVPSQSTLQRACGCEAKFDHGVLQEVELG